MGSRSHVTTMLATAGTLAALAALPAAGLAAGHAQPAGASRAAAATVNWQVRLTPGLRYPHARGSAQYQSQTGQRELQLELRRLRSLAGGRLAVTVDGRSLASLRVSRRGVAELTRNSEAGQRVPIIGHGSRLAIRTASGTLVAQGRF